MLLALAAPARGYDWQFEYVDTVGSWSSPSLKMSGTGVLHFCYRAPGNRVVHSYRDSVWHHEEIGPFETLYSYEMDAGAHGEFGLVLHLSGGFWLYEKQDTSWRHDSMPVLYSGFSYDSAGAPSVVFKLGDTVMYSRRAESTWVSETVAVAPMLHDYYVDGLTYTVSGEPCVVVYDDYWYLHYKDINLYIEQEDTWRGYGAAGGGMRSILDYVGCAPDTGGGAVVLYKYSDEFQPTLFKLSRYGAVDSGASAGAVAVHDSGVPHVAYIRNQLRYACRVGTTWYHDTVSAASSLQLAGIVLEDSLPVIGFVDPATGVWLARRLPAAIEEPPRNSVTMGSPLPNILRGVLRLPLTPCTTQTSLFDMAGRQVMALRPGANDVNRLAPGVYFVTVNGARNTVHVDKVVIQR
jgi:hypothetical protein